MANINQPDKISLISLDSANYYRHFTKHFALTAKVGDKNFGWEIEHRKVFKELKRTLCSTPIPASLTNEHSAASFGD